MKKKYVRVGFAQAQKNELWERWRRGEQMNPQAMFEVSDYLRSAMPPS